MAEGRMFIMNNKNEKSQLISQVVMLNENITRVIYNYNNKKAFNSNIVSEDFKQQKDIEVNNYVLKDNCILFKNKQGEIILKEVEHILTEKRIYKYSKDNNQVVKAKQTANGEVSYIESFEKEDIGKAYEGKLTFEITEEEGIYGLGQHEEGTYNYNGCKEYMYQTNMKIAIPFLISSRNYGILIDTETAMIFNSKKGKMTFAIDTTNEISYYIITGENFEEIINSLRTLTGKTPMLPRWAYGYIQSIERYHSSQELINTVLKFRKENIPIDCIVQDWCTWEDGLWGEKKVDKKRYPDIKKLTTTLHKANTKLMVSIWPNMGEGGTNHKEFMDKNLFLPNTNTYDAYKKEARETYWKQCGEEWFSGEIDAWWSDNTEPFSDADWNGETKRPEALRYNLIVEESKKSMDWTRINSYGLLHSKGIYDNWRKENSEKRVVNLTRSTYISGQRYGVIAWSGDISAKWSTLKKQIVEGIKFSMSGMPYWTVDIGAFFTVKDKWERRGCNCSNNTNPLWFWNGDYNNGVEDFGYRELYVRWLQFGTFLPIFRSHGTDTPREPWHFGSPGDIFYDTIVKFIKLRYGLLPYIYSVAADIYQNNTTLLRSLMFDFAYDEKVKNICDSFMFGKAMLVCPVTEPMYYDVNSKPLLETEKTRKVYLPNHTKWYDFWNNFLYQGGQILTFKATLDVIPIFVKAGSIIPVSDAIKYADEKRGEISEILIYSGEDGEFTLYNDAGDNYSYEKEKFSAIKLVYIENKKTLTFGKHMGTFTYQENFKIRVIEDHGNFKVIDFRYKGEEETISVQ